MGSPEVYLDDAFFATGLGPGLIAERSSQKSSRKGSRKTAHIVRDEDFNRCEECGQSFKGKSSKGNLKRHILAHTGEKPFPCDQCDQSFTRKEHMETHRRIHTGEKPYVCGMCSMAFSDKTGLRSHMKKH